MTTHPVFKSPMSGQVEKTFGPPGGPEATAGRCHLPFPFPLAWDGTQKIKSFACHRLLGDVLTSIFAEAVKAYGAADMESLGLTQFGGCFNHRLMRGGSSWSVHSWGAAVDLDPARNQLKWGSDQAIFARPAYDRWWGIVEAHGAFSLGRRKNYDWMHFQFVQV